MHPVEAFIRQRVNPPQQEIDQLIAKMKLRTLRKGEQFCELGQIPGDIGLLVTGKMRCFTLSETGDDTTIDFIFPVNLVAAFDAAVAGEPSRVAIEALEDCELYVCPLSVREDLIAHGDRAWMKLNQIEMEQLYRRKNQFAISIQSKDVTTRYRELLRMFPGVAKIRQYHLASYLGILPQSLSRIRARLARKKRS